MPASGATETCSVLERPLARDPATIRSHRIEGTTAAYLENAVSLALDCSLAGGRLEARMTVTNDRTGHHVPTGVTVPNVLLLVEARREDDGSPLEHLGEQVIHPLGGAGDPRRGDFAGQPGKMYAKVAHDARGRWPAFFTEATGLLSDTRLAALESDVTRYAFAAPAASTRLQLRARLIYRRAFRPLAGEKRWSEDGHGRPLADLAPPNFGRFRHQVAASSTPSPTSCAAIATAMGAGRR